MNLSQIRDRIKSFFKNKNQNMYECEMLSKDTEFNYIKDRVCKRINEFNKVKDRSKNHYRWFQISILSFGALITIINSLQFANFETRVITSILGALVTVLSAISQLEKFHEKMLIFKITLRRLEKELFLYKQAASHYRNKDDKEKDAVLAERIEDLLEKEAMDYISIFTDKSQKDKDKKNTENDGD